MTAYNAKITDMYALEDYKSGRLQGPELADEYAKAKIRVDLRSRWPQRASGGRCRNGSSLRR
jgi:hypothetical protein